MRTLQTAIPRRSFIQGLGAAAMLAWQSHAQSKRRLRVGHTGITWGFKPDDAPGAIRDVASLGYDGYETFGEYLDAWELKGGMKAVLDEARLPLISAYCNVNLTDPTKRADETAKLVRWAKLIRKCGGTTAVIGPNGVRRATFDFKAAKSDIVQSLNEVCRAAADAGVTAALHQHTGTCIESRDEVYAVMETVDTKVVRFGPDVGQLAKGGSDPVKVVKDFQSLIHHVHLKDWNGGPHWEQYCPLGQGKVDLQAVLDLLEGAPNMKIIMVELDPGGRPPLTPVETAKASKEYLTKAGYTFRG